MSVKDISCIFLVAYRHISAIVIFCSFLKIYSCSYTTTIPYY